MSDRGKLIAIEGTDAGLLDTLADGLSRWLRDAGVPVEQTAPADFATKRLRGGGNTIERASPGGEDWALAFEIPDGNSVFQAFRFAFAEGWVR